MTDTAYDVFLSYSRNDWAVAASLRTQLARRGLSVFKDDDSIRAGDLWLDRLQAAIDACGSFVVLVGCDGVGRWIGAETQAAVNRYFGPHEDAQRLPIFPILLGEVRRETLPAFLRLFQTTPWNDSDPLPLHLLEQVRERTIVATEAAALGCPFVGIAAYRIDQAHLFFGRQKETLDALACFDTRRGAATVRWLEISGNSGSGKSSLMNAGLLPRLSGTLIASQGELQLGGRWQAETGLSPLDSADEGFDLDAMEESMSDACEERAAVFFVFAALWSNFRSKYVMMAAAICSRTALAERP